MREARSIAVLVNRKLLKRGNFTSTDDLWTKVLDLIAYFNRTLAKPFKWTHLGKPLQPDLTQSGVTYAGVY